MTTINRRQFLYTGLGVSTLTAQSADRDIRIDASQATGRIRSLQGVNCGPAHTRAEVASILNQYRQLRIDSVRTHDFYGPGDIDAWRTGQPWTDILFPRWTADPDNPASYNFAPTDRLLKAIVDSGAQIYFRIGRSWNADATPPADFDKFARIVQNIVRHYNHGWANGHDWNIRHWEFWNEPDGRFWSGTPEQFRELYAKTVTAIKAIDPTLLTGACGLAGSRRPGPYREGFIRFCADQNIPLDFYSWHVYTASTYDAFESSRIARTIRTLLDQSGFEHAQSHLTEWNIDAGLSPNAIPGIQDSIISGAYVASSLIYMQDAPIDLAHFYRGDAAHPMGLFYNDGRPKKKAFAFECAGRMLDTPIRIPTTGNDQIGFATLAGISPDRRRLQLWISNYEAHPPVSAGTTPPRYENNRAYNLHIANLPWGNTDFRVQRFRTSETDDLRLIADTRHRGSSYDLRADLAPPAFDLLILSSAAD